MYLLGLLSCVLFLLVSGNVVPKSDEDPPNLKWPKKYTFKADKLSLTAGWVEDVSYWRTNKKSRVEYNKGAVKIISIRGSKLSLHSFGVKYEMHPETTEEILNRVVCVQTNGTMSSRISLEDVLPEVGYFEYAGKEVLDEGEVDKFVNNLVEDGTDYRQTIWASYDKNSKNWRPIRFEDVQYDTWLDYLKKHVNWNFYNFETEFDEDIFDVDEDECSDSDESTDDYHNKATKKHIHGIDPKNNDHVNLVFDAFKQKHSKIYANDKEHAMRKNIFKKNLRHVIENNRKNTGYKLAINKFADRTPEEMKKHMGLIRQKQRENDTHPFLYTAKQLKDAVKDLPKNFDLRDFGVITPVRDQEECGSCWSFGTTSAVEGALARKNGGRLLRLANQALIDCAWGFGVAGCDGGYDIGAYKWMMEYGLPTEEEYGPYANKDGFCEIYNMETLYRIKGFTNVTPFSVDALKVAIVNHGPLSVSIHVTDNLSLYKGGIFYDTECDPTTLNHEVSLVGYGEREGEEYWIVKNSWGQSWGVDGYMHISMRDNNCGVATEPTYVVF